MTLPDIIALARELQIEYWGQAERELAPTVQFALREKGNALGEFLTRVEAAMKKEAR